MPYAPRLPAESFTFALLRPDDQPLLAEWRAAAHVAPWFGPPATAVQDPHSEREAVRRFVASLDGRPIGMIQIYRWSDFPDNAVAVGARRGEVGIDYLIGEQGLIGHGVGPAMITAFLQRETLGRSDVTGVRVDVSEANRRSWRCLEKLGFRRDREAVLIPGQTGPHYVYVRDSPTADAGDAIVRRARPDEGKAIAEVWLAARRAAAIPAPVHSDAEVLSWISGLLLPSCEVWVAVAEDEVVGMMALDGEWVEQLYVLPEHQRRGHGARLLAQAMSDRSALTLWTFASNAGAQRFYEAHGFAPTGLPSDDNEEHQPAILYRWESSS